MPRLVSAVPDLGLELGYTDPRTWPKAGTEAVGRVILRNMETLVPPQAEAAGRGAGPGCILSSWQPWCSLERTQSSPLGLWSQRVSQADVGPDLSHMESSGPEIPPLGLSNSFLLAIKDNFISYLVFFCC